MTSQEVTILNSESPVARVLIFDTRTTNPRGFGRGAHQEDSRRNSARQLGCALSSSRECFLDFGYGSNFLVYDLVGQVARRLACSGNGECRDWPCLRCNWHLAIGGSQIYDLARGSSSQLKNRPLHACSFSIRALPPRGALGVERQLG